MTDLRRPDKEKKQGGVLRSLLFHRKISFNKLVDNPDIYESNRKEIKRTSPSIKLLTAMTGREE